MRSWTYTLGGLLIWSVHFLGVYGIASLGDVITRAEDWPFRMAALAFSVLCLAGAGAATFVAVQRMRRAEEGVPSFMDQLAALGGAVAMIAIAWQALPTFVGY